MPPLIGIGPALRKAREARSKTIDEAARDTKIRADYLQALERESFDALLGDAYTRGFLRSYSQYLGLDPDKVLGAYSKSQGEQEPADFPELEAEADRPSSPLHPRDRPRSWILAGGVAFIVILFAAIFGMLSRSHSVPPSSGLPSVVPSVVSTEPQISVGLIAKHEVPLVVSADGQVIFSGVLRAQEARSFEGVREVTVQLARGGVVTFKVNGEDLGAPGEQSHPYNVTFHPPSPSPSEEVPP